ASRKACRPSNAATANNTPPAPMPTAAATPSDRDDDIAVRATITKLGPGLTTPTVRAVMTPKRADTFSICLSERLVTAKDQRNQCGCQVEVNRRVRLTSGSGCCAN